MSRLTLLRISLAAVCVFAPLTAQAYNPPQDALFDENIHDGFLLPPTKREVEDRVTQQQLRSAQRRNQEQAATFGSGRASAPEDEEDLHSAAWGEEEEAMGEDLSTNDQLKDVLTSIEQTLSGIREDSQTVENRRRDRLLDRLDERQYEQQTRGAAYANIQYGPGELHSGAPLAHTGPESWLAGGTMLGAIAWTMLRARRVQPR